MRMLFDYIVFPGLLFTAVVGMLASWVDRKVTARVQYRQGPPWYQSFSDFGKLLVKDVIVPSGANKTVFLAAPVFGLAAVTLAAAILWNSNFWPGKTFMGDFIVVIYLLTIPAISIMMGGFASRNPISSIGASREMKLILSYELPFILALLVPVVKSGGMIRLGDIVTFQAQNGVMLGHASGVIAFVVALLCMQAKIGYVPFDIAEAEQEIIAGPLTEYSGAALGMFRLTKQMMLVAMPLFLMTMFTGGFGMQGIGILWGILKYVGLLVFIVVVKNTNPRLRIDQAVKFFWGPVTALAIVAAILALLGM